MTLCRSRGEPGRARHRGEQVQCRLWCSARCSPFSQAFAPETQFAGRSKAQAHCLAPEGSPLNRSQACIIRNNERLAASL
jgi:hypothetical protein